VIVVSVALAGAFDKPSFPLPVHREDVDPFHAVPRAPLCESANTASFLFVLFADTHNFLDGLESVRFVEVGQYCHSVHFVFLSWLLPVFGCLLYIIHHITRYVNGYLKKNSFFLIFFRFHGFSDTLNDTF